MSGGLLSCSPSMYMLINQNKMKNKNTTMSEQFQSTTEKSLEKVKLIPNPQIHDRSLSELGTGASIKSVGLN